MTIGDLPKNAPDQPPKADRAETEQCMTVGTFRQYASDRLRAAGCADPEIDADWILAQTLDVARSSLSRRARDVIADADALRARIDRRAAGEPLQYVLGDAPFLGLTIRCDARALIPRPETEYLAEMAVARARIDRPRRALDLCCGTGALGLAVKKHVPECDVTLADLSGDALALARENADALGITARFAKGDLFGAVGDETFDLILCNPPYLDAADMDVLQPEVRREPRMALFGGADGLDFYRRLARELPSRLNPGGRAWFEVGAGQAETVAALMSEMGRTEIIEDLSRVARIVAVMRTA